MFLMFETTPGANLSLCKMLLEIVKKCRRGALQFSTILIQLLSCNSAYAGDNVESLNYAPEACRQ